MKIPKKRRKLKNYLFVNKAQVTILISNLVLLLLVIAIFIMAVVAPFYSDIFKTEDIYQQNLSADYFIILLERSTFVFIIILVLLLIQQVFVIHRICGPFVSFKKMMDKLIQGDFSQKIYLRRGDFFHKEADQINDILEKVSTIISRVNDNNHAIVKDIDEFMSSQTHTEQPMESIKRIKNQARHSIEELDRIKVISR